LRNAYSLIYIGEEPGGNDLTVTGGVETFASWCKTCYI